MKLLLILAPLLLVSCAAVRVRDADGVRVTWIGTKDHDVKIVLKDGSLQSFILNARTNPETVEAVGSMGGSFVGSGAKKLFTP